MTPIQLATLRKLIAASALALCSMGLAGCGGALSPSNSGTPVKTSPAILSGRVQGGQQPISGSVIQLYAVGTTGLKSAATPLIAATVTTDQNGAFSITGDWDCTSNTAVYGTNPLLYIVGSGGNPGLSAGANNSAIELMAALGPCSGINSSTVIWMDEITTVAAAYALAPFMADVAHVGATGANAVGLVNAFNTANMLANTTNGTAPGTALPASATAPIAEINSLADIVAACVNTSGIGGACSMLFSATTPSGGSAPVDIVGAILNMVASPAHQATALFNMIPLTPPFEPGLGTAPNDWTVALNFTGGGLSSPAGLALDASGNVWVANAGGNSVTELNPAGVFLTGTSGYTGSNNILGAQGIAVDKTGNVWIADTLLSSVVEVNVVSGNIQSSTSFTNGGISGPIGIAIDSQNNVWVANFAGASVTELNSSGIALGSSPLTANAQLQAPAGIAIDSGGRVWVSDNAASVVVEFGSDQTVLSGNGYSDSAILGPMGVATDAGGRAWIAYPGTNAVSYFAGTNAPTPYTGGGISMPNALAVDGQGTVWVANSQAVGSISKLALNSTTPLSPAAGFGALNFPSSIAVDASGNVWTANAGDNSVTEFVGLAAPVAIPLALNAGP